MSKTIKQIADYLKINKLRVYRYIKANEIQAEADNGGTLLYSDADSVRIINHFRGISAGDAEIDMMLKQFETAEKSLDTANDTGCYALPKEVEALIEQYETPKQHIDTITDTADMLSDTSRYNVTQSFDTLMKDNDTLIQQNEALVKQVEMLQKQTETYQNDLKQLTDTLHEIQIENATYKERISQLEKALEKSERRAEEQEQERKAYNALYTTALLSSNDIVGYVKTLSLSQRLFGWGNVQKAISDKSARITADPEQQADFVEAVPDGDIGE